VKKYSVFYMSKDSTRWVLKTNAAFWRTLDDCFSQHKFNGPENRVIVKAGGYAVLDYEGRIEYIKWP
jgi:hypothetical protein